MHDTLSDKLSSEDNSSNREGQRPTNEELGKLYPNPKTYDEKLEDRKTIQAKILAKQPRHIVTYVAVRLFVVVFLGVLVITAAPQIVMWNVISGVFFVVLLALLWLGIVAWQYSEISSILYKKDLNSGSFFGFYLLIIAPLMIVACYIINERAHGYFLALMYGLLFLMHTLCLHLLIKNLSRQR